VTVVAINDKVSEAGPNVASLMFTREGGKIETPLVVTFSLTGTATVGADYANPGTSVTFLPYSSFATVKIAPIKDTIVEGDETVILKLTAKPGVNAVGEASTATVTITDASSSSASSNSTNPSAPPIVDPRTKLPPGDLTGSLIVSISFDGTGYWKHPHNGAYSNMRFHRELSYTVPLRVTYGPGSGIAAIDHREQQGMMMPDFKRYLVGRPRDAVAAAGTPCGRGTTSILDESSGMEVGDPGQAPLVTFTQQIKGGGVYPSGDKTVPERDLCLTNVVVDNQKHLLHLQLDGTDTHVKVINSHNGHQAPAYNLKLQGDAPDAKSKFTLFDLPIPVGVTSTEGSKLIPNVSTISGPDHSVFPLNATVKWRVVMK
jgi:WD40 repeat protein